MGNLILSKKSKMKKSILLATFVSAIFILSCNNEGKNHYDYCDCIHMLKVKDIDPNLRSSCEEVVQAHNDLEKLSPGSTDPNECK